MASSATEQNVGAPASHPYTCNTCQVAFRNSDLQKGHMRGDWHRYNLKRRVASLPPISSEVFSDKVLQARASTTADADRVGFERGCDVCQKTYYSENSFRNHLSSQKHKAKQAAAAQTQGTESVHGDEASSIVSSTFSLGDPQPTTKSQASIEVDSDAEEEFSQVVEGIKLTSLNERPSPVKRPSNPHLSAAGQNKTAHPLSPPAEQDSSSATPTPSKSSAAATSNKSCLFCNYNSPTVPLNIAHMERFHGLFIPEKQYLVDVDGLIAYLQNRIREDCECIFCGKVKNDVFAVQTHMRDTSHCKIPYTTIQEQLEIGDFYDFRSTYSDDGSDDEDMEDADDKQNGGAKLGGKRATKTTGEDGDVIMGEEDGWETDSSASSLDSADLTAVPADQHYHQYERLGKHPHHSSTDPRAHHQRDGWHSHGHKHNRAVFYDEYELHLPSGKSVGHRANNRYFRQNLRNYPSVAERERVAQLAIENGDEDDDEIEEMDVDGRLQLSPPASRGRSLRTTRNLGLINVSEKAKRELTKHGHKSERIAEAAVQRRAAKFSSKSIGSSFRWGGSAASGVGGR